MIKSFIECNCFLINKKLADLDVPTQDTPARITFRACDVTSFREIVEEEEISEKECIVYMNSGDSFVIDMPYDELKKKLKECGHI